MRAIVIFILFVIPIAGISAGDPIPQILLDPILVRLLENKDASLIDGLREGRQPDLLKNLGIGKGQAGIQNAQHQRKSLVYHQEYNVGNKLRHVFVYSPNFRSWPGLQPETIVITNGSYRPLDWKEVGGSPMFERASLEEAKGGEPVLRIIRNHRHEFLNPKQGVYRFSLKDDTVTPTSDVEWLYRDDAERAEYARRREALREYERANRKGTGN